MRANRSYHIPRYEVVDAPSIPPYYKDQMYNNGNPIYEGLEPGWASSLVSFGLFSPIVIK